MRATRRRPFRKTHWRASSDRVSFCPRRGVGGGVASDDGAGSAATATPRLGWVDLWHLCACSTSLDESLVLARDLDTLVACKSPLGASVDGRPTGDLRGRWMSGLFVGPTDAVSLRESSQRGTQRRALTAGRCARPFARRRQPSTGPCHGFGRALLFLVLGLSLELPTAARVLNDNGTCAHYGPVQPLVLLFV